MITHEDISAREKAFGRRRRRAWILGGILVASISAAVGFGGRPALHQIKAWQARRLAGQARVLMDQGKWPEARQRAADAYAIWPEEPDAIRTIAEFLTRVGGSRQAINFWRQLEKLGLATASDERSFAAAEAQSGEIDAAEVHLHRAWPEGTVGTAPDWLVALPIALQRGEQEKAAALAQRLLGDSQANERTRLVAAAALVSVDRSPEAQRTGWETLKAIADGRKSAEALEALLALVRRIQAGPIPEDLAGIFPTFAELSDLLDAHPLARIRQHLLATDLRAAAGPEHAAELIRAATDRFASTREDDELAVLAAWLSAKGQVEPALGLLPPERAKADRALFLQRLDLLGALGRWEEIRAAIQGRQYPLEPTLAQMYLARCAAQLGEPAVSDACWQSALTSAGTDPQHLLMVGEYAAKNGALPVAERALRAAVTATPDSREANQALFQVLESTSQTRALREALIAFSALAPEDRALRNDIAYFDALLEIDVPAAREVARELVQTEPASLPHRITLALAELRLHNNFAALEALTTLSAFDPSALPPRQRAVYAAVLWETSYEKQARELSRTIETGRLLPEEAALVRPISASESQ